MKPEDFIGANKAHTENVLLVFWGNNCSPNKKAAAVKPLSWHWSDKPPTIREIEVACIGSLSGKGGQHVFEVDGILPQSRMPQMEDGQRRMFLKALITKLMKQTQCVISPSPLKIDLGDWEGMNRQD